MKGLVTIILILFISSFAEARSEILSFEELGERLFRETNGVVNVARESSIEFKLNPKSQRAFAILDNPNPDLIHSLFKTDVLKFVDHYKAQDFLRAKKKFYQNQKFNSLTQQYSRPYPYLSDWKSLNHSPLRTLDLPLPLYGRQFESLGSEKIQQSPLISEKFQLGLDQVTQTQLTAGNKLRLLSNGEQSFKEKLRMVRETKHFFHAVVMVQYCDEKSSEMVEALIERAQAGVDVRLILEEAWTRLILKNCLNKLIRGGVKVTLGKGFLNPKTLFTVYHSKFWIRDGEEAIMGGMNMHDFENASNGFNNHTRDKDVHVTGPAVTDMMKQYVRIWNHEQETPDESMKTYLRIVEEKEAQEKSLGLRGIEFYKKWLNQSNVSDIPGVCRVLVQGTKLAGQENIIAKAYIEIMKNVKHQMLINTLSFNFKKNDQSEFSNTKIIKTLSEASKRDVTIDLVTNGVDAGFGEAGFQLRELAKKFNQKGQRLAARGVLQLEKTLAPFTGRSQRKNLMAALSDTTVDVWFYFNHIHSKQMEFDQIMTSTGSFNLDTYSHRNHESTLICLDKKLADESLKEFAKDIVNSTPAF